MKYDFYKVLGIDRDANLEDVTIALYSKLETLKDTKDIGLWNYLLRTASELQIQIDRSRLDSQQEVSKEFYSILGVDSDTNIEDIAVLLNTKYNDPDVLTDTRIWNILHREAEKLGISDNSKTIVSKNGK